MTKELEVSGYIGKYNCEALVLLFCGKYDKCAEGTSIFGLCRYNYEFRWEYNGLVYIKVEIYMEKFKGNVFL